MQRSRKTRDIINNKLIKTLTDIRMSRQEMKTGIIIVLYMFKEKKNHEIYKIISNKTPKSNL